MSSNFARFIIDRNQYQSDKIAIVDDNKQITYSDLERYILSFSYILYQSGVQPQDRIIICMDDCVEWPIAFLSIIAVGGNPVLVSVDLPISTIEKVCEITDAKFSIGKKIANLKSFAKDIIMTEANIYLPEFYQYHNDEMCFWLLSSGTTGEPKCVVHRHCDLEILLDLVAWPAYRIDKDSKILSTAKLSFTYGFNNSLTFGLGKGATVFLINGKPAPSKIYERIRIDNITHFFTVPTVINSMLKHPADYKISNKVKIMVSSGEPLPRLVAKKFQQFHDIDILDGLGMSECMYNYCTNTPSNFVFGTIGRPLPGIECEVRDDNGNLTLNGEIGELWVKHPCAAIQYWKDWYKTKSTFIGDWIKTGDKVIKLSNGNYKYVSRKDDLLKINGMYVSPIEIENAIMEIPSIIDCGVVAKINDYGLPELHAFVFSNQTQTVANLRQALSNRLPDYKLPKKWHFIDEIPKTVTGKKNRNLLRQGRD